MKKLALVFLTLSAISAQVNAMHQTGRPLNRCAHRNLTKQLSRKFSTENQTQTNTEELKKISKFLEEKIRIDQSRENRSNILYLSALCGLIAGIVSFEKDNVKNWIQRKKEKIKNLAD